MKKIKLLALVSTVLMSFMLLSCDQLIDAFFAQEAKTQYMEIGSWPQTIKSADVKVDETQTKKVGMFTYCKGSDGEWYCKIKENGYNGFQRYSDNSQVKREYQNSERWFKVEPIRWRILTNNYDGKKLLLAEKGVMSGIAFYDDYYLNYRTIKGKTIYANNYEHSVIRAWLNGLSYQSGTTQKSDFLNNGFLQTAFTAEELKKIATMTIDNSRDSTIDADDKQKDYVDSKFICGNTQDRVFLLSKKEATTADYGFAQYDVYINDENGTTESSRVRIPTDFALANHAAFEENYGGSPWFLRSPCNPTRFGSSEEQTVASINSEGAACYETRSGDGFLSADIIVPAIAINP